MTEILTFIAATVASLTQNGVPNYVIAAAGLAVFGWLLPKAMFRLTGVGRRSILRTAVLSALILVAMGAVMSAALYLASGVRLAAAMDSDPWGGVAYFTVTGAQLAVAGLCLMSLRTALLAGRGAHRSLK